MHVMVLGAGLSGVTTAWYLQQAGFGVSIVDRQPGPALETSFANGGQISISHPEPWANPGAPLQVLRWLGRDDAPLKFRPTTDPAQWWWGARFLLECLPTRAHRNTAAIAALARWSSARLHELRARTGLQYDQLERGILHLFHSPHEFAQAPARARQLELLGIEARVCSRTECLAIEPALTAGAGTLAGGLFAPGDESGDAFRFTRELAARVRENGADLHWECDIRRLTGGSGTRLEGVEVCDAEGRQRTLRADAYVICLGSYGPRLVAPLGERLPIYPVKGYSITAPLLDAARAPSVSLTDESRRIVCSRLGDRLRVAGTAELNGFDTRIRNERIRPILEWVKSRFPGAIDEHQVEPWAGLRPATPGNLPVIGRGRAPNLWFNTGHGTLGWTLACGSAAALAELMRGRPAPVSFPFRLPR
ncbi:D-amino acid dehydrogenase [Thauera chlorobenzoica]|nr:D-amino acid dehydrogenase [Thauera chlorobenzoica]SEF72858.1 D-amino-acid dehydrogenase [Thauera chlorobenzoica]